MPFIGNKPSAVPLTSADITDGIITSAKIADGTIVNADISATAAIAGSKLSGAGFSGSATTSSAVDITLTNTSTQVQSISMTAADKSVILPDATTLTTKGFPVFVIHNQGYLNFNVKNSSGYTIAIVTPASILELSLIDNSTSAGVFATENNPINFGFSEFLTIASDTYGTGGRRMWGPATYGLSIDKISSTVLLTTYHKGTSQRDIYGRILTISGNSFTISSETIMYNGSSTASLHSSMVMLDATNGLLLVTRTSNSVVVPFTISGTTITVGTTSSTFGTGVATADAVHAECSQLTALTSTLAIFSHRTATTGSDYVIKTITHNGGSAPTIGSASSSITTSTIYSPISFKRMSDTTAFAAYAVSNKVIARVITVSGSSAPTLGTANTTSAKVILAENVFNILDNSTSNFTVYSNYGYANFTTSGTTVTFVEDNLFTIYNNVAASGSYPTSHAKFTNFVFHGNWNSTGSYKYRVGNNLANFAGLTTNKSLTHNDDVTVGTEFLTIDSTTGFVVTNAGLPAENKIYGAIIKYIGI